MGEEAETERDGRKGWEDLSTAMKVFWIFSGLAAVALGVVLGVILTFS